MLYQGVEQSCLQVVGWLEQTRIEAILPIVELPGLRTSLALAAAQWTDTILQSRMQVHRAYPHCVEIYYYLGGWSSAVIIA